MTQTPITYRLVLHAGTGDVWSIKERGETVVAVRKCKPGELPAASELDSLTYEVGNDLNDFLATVSYNWRPVV